MKKFNILVWTAIITSTSLVMAQPPEEELSPTAPEFNIEVMDAPAPAEPAAQPAANAQQTVEPIQPAQIPLTGVKAPEEPKEDKAIKGILLSPSIKIEPIGYNGERKQSFLEVAPGVALDTVFKTGAGREVSLNLGYSLTWDEFLSNRAAALRYFEHDLSGSATIAWTDTFATAFSSGINYSLWASDNREHAVINDTSAMGTFKINDSVSIATGYRAFFFNDLDTQFRLSDGTFPGDADDLVSANSAIGGSTNTYLDPLSPSFDYDPVAGHSWFTNNGLKLKPTYKVGSTSLAFDYEFVFYTFTNDPSADWRGHFLTPSISQGLPWKGGSLSLKNQLRLRNYQSKTNDDGNLTSNFRNRLTIELSQTITDTISASTSYRWQWSGSNADNYAVKASEHLIHFGFTFSF